ncbi:MAG: L-erythro-3,5-diaminohexanoate dehydrogenase [Deltaproteobacteria bacterium]|nr:MAG: L-erythro-3,5-diaminohexanoate dehydrogenase [Deltaproteobacteria bacterium]
MQRVPSLDDLGVHRVLTPSGALPQAADRLDASLPLRDNEVRIDVDTLNIDSASFAQIVGEVGRDEARVGERIAAIVAERGKMQNPVTGSGGMLLGTVGAMGAAYGARSALAVGDRVATLVSLTLTPLHLEAVRRVCLDTDQVEVRGHAILWPSSPVVRMPADLPEPLALACLDVCGAPAQVARMVRPGMRVLVIGAGKSGLLCMAEARRQLGGSGRLVGVDLRPGWLPAAEQEGVVDAWGVASATEPCSLLDAVVPLLGGQPADLVINTANVAGTEMASILAVRDGGTVYFFNMATSFSRATLGAEGIGRDATLIMGNGFAPGHAELALELVREVPFVRARFGEMAGVAPAPASS